jgi:uncharacterized membrane protein YhaH (DUF805 family)
MRVILSAGMMLFDPRGRADRSHMLVAAGALLMLETLVFLVQDRLGGAASPSVMAVKVLMALIGLVAIIRRLHDLGLSGWWALGGLAGLCMWTAVIALAGMLLMGRDVLAPGSLSAIVIAGCVMLPALGATLWLHLAEGDAFRNQFGYPCRTALAWLGRQGSNLEMAVPKTAALPFGYAPIHHALTASPRKDNPGLARSVKK